MITSNRRVTELSSSLTQVTLDDLIYAVESKYWDGDTTLVVALNIVSLLSDYDRRKYYEKYYRKNIRGNLYKTSNSNHVWHDASISAANLVYLTAYITRYSEQHTRIELGKYISNRLFFSIRGMTGRRQVVYPSRYPCTRKDCSGHENLWDYNTSGEIRRIPEQLLKERLMEYEDQYERKSESEKQLQHFRYTEQVELF